MTVFNFIKSTWSASSSSLGDTNMDGITQLSNSAKQLNEYEWNTTVLSECNKIIKSYVPKLNNETFVMDEMTKNTHTLPGIVGAVGQCSMYFPDIVQTKYNWRCCAPFM